MASRRRISFSVYDAAHVYELALENFCVSKKEGICPACRILKERFEKFLGKKEVERIRRLIKKHPYIKKEFQKKLEK